MNDYVHCAGCGCCVDTGVSGVVLKDGCFFCTSKCSEADDVEKEDKEKGNRRQELKKMRELKNDIIRFLESGSPAHAHTTMHRYLEALGYSP